MNAYLLNKQLLIIKENREGKILVESWFKGNIVSSWLLYK